MPAGDINVTQQMKIIEKIKNWYRGQYIPTTTAELFNQPIPGEGHFKPPLFAKMINGTGKFWLKHWQWIITTFIAIIVGSLMVYFTYLKLLQN